LGAVIFNVENEIGGPEEMVGREYVKIAYLTIIITICSTGIVCKET